MADDPLERLAAFRSQFEDAMDALAASSRSAEVHCENLIGSLEECRGECRAILADMLKTIDAIIERVDGLQSRDHG